MSGLFVGAMPAWVRLGKVFMNSDNRRSRLLLLLKLSFGRGMSNSEPLIEDGVLVGAVKVGPVGGIGGVVLTAVWLGLYLSEFVADEEVVVVVVVVVATSDGGRGGVVDLSYLTLIDFKSTVSGIWLLANWYSCFASRSLISWKLLDSSSIFMRSFLCAISVSFALMSVCNVLAAAS